MSFFLTQETLGVGLGGSATANGYTYLPGGLILQWATVAVANSSVNSVFTYSVAFPTAPLALWGAPVNANLFQSLIDAIVHNETDVSSKSFDDGDFPPQ